MKKITYSVLFSLLIATTACNNNGAATENKIDFTQSYENAALALTTAQNNLNTALATHDDAKINEAKKALQTATNNYVTTKNNLIQHGGVIKQEYESNLQKSEQTLSTIATVSTPNTKDSTIGGKVGSTINNDAQKIDKIKTAGQNTANNTLDHADKAIQNIQAKKAKAQQDIQNMKEQAQKDIKETNEKSKKLKDDFNKLFQ